MVSIFWGSFFQLVSSVVTRCTLVLISLLFSSSVYSKQVVNALYIPLADHYAALVAYERYGQQMKHADFHIEQMKNWDLLRAKFQAGLADMAYVMSPLAMQMYTDQPDFRWIGLMHRDGNALAINDLLKRRIDLPADRAERKPSASVAGALRQVYQDTGQSTEIGMPHLQSTHTVVLYRYLKEHGLSLGLQPDSRNEVLAISVAPPKSPAFIKGQSNRARAAAFQQSLPWADIVETRGFGHVAWYSKDVMPWPSGHVECIALATDQAIAEKEEALREVMYYIHKAGADIEMARRKGGESMQEIVEIIRKHIPAHSKAAITASLDPRLKVINYLNLNVDKAGLKQIMDYAVEGEILKQAIDIDEFADTRFAIEKLKSGQVQQK